MKRISTLLVLACWLVLLFVVSTVTLSLEISKQNQMAAEESEKKNPEIAYSAP